MRFLLLYSLLTVSALSQEINDYFLDINQKTTEYNHIGATIAWESSVKPNDPTLPERSANYQKNRILWQQTTCERLAALENRQLLNDTHRRQTYLLCRGPKFTFNEAQDLSAAYKDIQTIYENNEICVPNESKLETTEDIIKTFLNSVKEYLQSDWPTVMTYAVRLAEESKTFCLKGEDEINRAMKTTRDDKVMEFLWLAWREKIGNMRKGFKDMVAIENAASIRNGYTDIGAAWRDELEIPNLRKYCRQLYYSIRPLYSMLHGVVRFYLRRIYGDIVPEKGPIPAHLLGNLWSQNWETMADLIVPITFNLDESIKNRNWNITQMVKRTEDFYMSMSLPAMTDTFWRESVFAPKDTDTRCHGTAADMFKNGDFRLLYCSNTSFEDFYVLHHEMGHIQYYMAYENQPGLFRQGANSAFHEAIGDAIMNGVVTPQHLNRLGLINDTLLYSTANINLKTDINKVHDDFKINFTPDDAMFLKQALRRIPLIPFSLAIDEYRWKYFEGDIEDREINEEFWRLTLELQGIAPPSKRGEEYFDIGANFHVADNTPHIRYFLSSFLHHQILESLCKAAVFGRRNVNEPMPDSIVMHRCDIYGSKAAGKLLRDLMSRGTSQNWIKILKETTGKDVLTASALKRYYRPMYKTLRRLVEIYRIPIGW